MRDRRPRLSASGLGAAVAALPMDEPPAEATGGRAAELAAAFEDLSGELDGEARALAGACAEALAAAASRRVLFVYAVPLVVAAAELLSRARPAGDAAAAWDRGLAGARYEIETILPGPIKPDVERSALIARSRRGPTSDTRG